MYKRQVYNYYLEKKKEANLSCFDMIKDLKKLQAEHQMCIRDRFKKKNKVKMVYRC